MAWIVLGALSFWAGNALAASYPSSVFSFTTHNTGDIIQANDVNAPDNEIVAIESGLLNGLAHTVKPLTTNTYDLGTTSFLWRNFYLQGFEAIGTNPAGGGVIRLANSAAISFRNGANSGDVQAMTVDGSNDVRLGDNNGLTTAIRPVADNVVQLGYANTRFTQAFFSTSVAVGTNASGTGLLRLSYGAGGIYFRNQANGADYQAMDLATIGATNVVAVGTGGSTQGVAIGTGGIATNATTGWPYIPSSAGAPSGTPVTVTGFVPVQWNDTGRQLHVYSTGLAAWLALVPTSTAQATSASTPTTTSSTFNSTGLGVTYTPKSSGRVLVIVTCPITLSATGASAETELAFFAGGIPAANAAMSGTVFGGISSTNTSAAAAPYMTSNVGVATGLTLGTSYAFYVGFASNNNVATVTYGGAAGNFSIAVIEL